MMEPIQTFHNTRLLGVGHSPRRWGYYNEELELVREVPEDEVPRFLQLAKSASINEAGYIFQDPDGDGYYVCFWH